MLGRLLKIRGKEDLQLAERHASASGWVVMDATDWRVIPAENLVAAFQGSKGQLLALTTSAADARLMLEALEMGTAGVILRTDDPVEVTADLYLCFLQFLAVFDHCCSDAGISRLQQRSASS